MIAILGATNTGKTGIGIKLAKSFPIEVISMDSRQIYRKFDVGTGKLPVGDEYLVKRHDDFWEIDGARIWGYDLVNPDENFSAHDFKKFALDTKLKIEKDSKIPMFIGGTGFYYDTLLTSSTVNVEPDIKLRDTLSEYSSERLLALFPKEYIEMLNESEKHNPQRLIRRYEIYKSTGKIFLPQNRTENQLEPIILSLPRTLLYEKVDLWVNTIWQPLLNELECLVDEGYVDTIPMNGIIYSTVRDFLCKRNAMSEIDCKQKVKHDIHSYIRRQETWFKRYPTAYIIDMSSTNSYNQIEGVISKYIDGK